VYEPISPPADLIAEVVGEDDILLRWNASNSTIVDHYLIYRSEHPIEFDFSNPLHDTSIDSNPLATSWMDQNAANLSAPQEYYYTVRGVSFNGSKSTTSNTAGKYTKPFGLGTNAFSLPLEPFIYRNVSWYVEEIPHARYIRWMDSTGHWVTHQKGQGEGTNDITVQMGSGYEIQLHSPSTYTFTGYPAAMIRFKEGFGDNISFRRCLQLEVQDADVILSWVPVDGASGYQVFKSDRRSGLHDPFLEPVTTSSSSETSWKDVDALSSTLQFYYMVIPLNSWSRPGSSTYSVGVITVVYERGSDTFALPLRPMDNHTLDWYCDAIPDVAGMAYMIFELWKYHGKEMPQGVYDVDVLQGEGYQISIDSPSSKFTFVGY